MTGNDLNDVIESPLPLAPIVGRRRTRATAQLDLEQRRELFKRRRERAVLLEQAARHNSNNSTNNSTTTSDTTTTINSNKDTYMADDNAENVHINTSTPPRTARSIALQDSRSSLDTTNTGTARALASPTVKIVVGASFGDKISANSVIERTPTKRELQSPPQIRRMKSAPQVVVPTPEKAVPASAGLEEVEPAAASSGDAAATTTTEAQTTTMTAAAISAVSDSAAFPGESATVPDTKDAPVLKPKRVAARGIAQSGSSFSTRKRMISFSPERDERPENRALALLKLEKNLKATAKLQQRLEGVGVMSRNEEPRSAFTTPLKDRTAAASVLSARMLQSPSATYTTPVKPMATTPGVFETPSAPTNITLEFPSDDEDEDHNGHDVTQRRNSVVTPVKRAPVMSTSSQDAPCDASQDAIDREDRRIDGEDNNDDDELECCATQVLCSQVSEAESLAPPLSCSQEPSQQLSQPQRTDDFGSSSSMAFTSTSVIEDVGLFNCEFDVEYTGGVYGEGTDGKVSAAVINGQKVALKRAKPHEGFPEDEAKRRSAVELHYLRRVRHMQGFVQCLGLCDGIDHTCIALEVMDCKLSDYLRRYGTNTSSSRASSAGASTNGSKRRFVLAPDVAKSLLKQIALPMMLLHDQVNVAHGDLACRNILLRTPPKGYEQKWEPVVKLSDFGRIRVPSTEPKILDERFSFFKNCDVGAFGREILYRFLVGEIVPPSCLETRSLHKQLQDVVVTQVPDAAKDRLGPYYRLFMRCTGWGVRPTFREIYDHLDDLEYFETTENGLFPLKPSGSATADASFLSPVLDSSRPNKFVSSGGGGSKVNGGGGSKYDTPSGAQQRTSNGAARLLQSKSGTTDGSVATGHASHNKTVNLLKPRSVLRGTPHKVANPNASGAAPADKLHPRNLATTSGFTPNGRPMLLKKTPPSAGASRRSLQILSQIQHRTTGADKAK